jgi:hypothetical protein
MVAVPIVVIENDSNQPSKQQTPARNLIRDQPKVMDPPADSPDRGCMRKTSQSLTGEQHADRPTKQ